MSTNPVFHLNPGDYTKDAWIQASPDAKWQHIAEFCTDGEVAHFRDGIRIEPFDFDEEFRTAHRRAEYHVREGDFVITPGET